MPYLAQLLLIAGFGIQGCVGPSTAQDALPERIGFVTLRITGSSVHVVEATARPGTLKRPRGEMPDLGFGFDVFGAEDAIIWTGSMEDPLVERIEYVDDEGNLRSRFVEHDEVEITIRIPVTQPEHTVQFYRTDESAKARSIVGEVHVTF